ncbi:MAG: PAS domain S-box protein [Bryobacteraceae bacterium]
MKYAVSIVTVLAAVFVRRLMTPSLDEVSPFLIFTLAVVFSAWYGGLGPGLLATALSAAAVLAAQPSAISATLVAHTILFLSTGVAVVWSITGSRRTSQILERTHRRIGDILDSMRDGFVVCDRDWRILNINRQAGKLTGRVRAELLGLTLWEAFQPVTEPEFESELRRSMEAGQPAHFEHHAKRMGRWFEVDGYPSEQGFSLFLRDVTRRLLSLQALKESEEHLHLAISAASMGAWSYDFATGRVTFSPEMETLIGTKSVEVESGLGAYLALLHPEDRAAAGERFETAIRENAEFEVEYRLNQPSAPARWMLGRGRGVSGPDGTPVRLYGVTVDVTARKEAEEALRQSERLFRELANTAPVLIWTAGPDGVRNFFNRSWFDFTGRSAEQEEGGGWLDGVHPDDARRAGDSFRQAREGGREVQIEYRLQRAGVYRSVLDTAVPRRLPDGGLAGYIGCATDITARKRSEEQSRETLKIESLGLMAGGLAHDFNNLLIGIIGNASLALHSVTPGSETEELLRDVIASGERLAELTRQMLAYAGKGRFVVGPVDLSQVVRETAEMLAHSIPEWVRVDLDLAPGLPRVMGDARQLQQVVANLVTNAVEAVGSGQSGSVTVSTKVEQIGEAAADERIAAQKVDSGTYVCLQVEDNGCGIDETNLPRIFDPFFTTKFTGRGLGLSAAMGAVRGHHGAIEVRSTPGAGSTFRVLLPVARESELVETPQVHARPQKGVLIIDDEAIVLRTARSALEHYGYRVLVAEDGRDGIRVFEERSGEIDAVLLDLTMPNMNGVEALAHLQRIRPGVRVVLSSGFDEAEAVQRFTGKGLAGFIQKPYSAQALAHKLSGLLG